MQVFVEFSGVLILLFISSRHQQLIVYGGGGGYGAAGEGDDGDVNDSTRSWGAFRFVHFALAVEVKAEATVCHLHAAMLSIATFQTGPLDLFFHSQNFCWQ